ncbi:hypothetical protein Desti_3452 [Desulfomonile tiedjei DSM 6799]|uniref:Restriction endonuclease n=2 Tax=Desulfomonile tiedjei TaxID=2358 RepID=I4C963_DESTA|nr:hypothetical protein Desti_3452 [Desulfomonile tiedjei DSM 6799]
MCESRMRLFDGVESLGDRTILYNESGFDYLQGSGRPEMIRVKDLLESWFSDYPDENKEALRKRLRGEKQNGQKHKLSLRRSSFQQAFFELYVYTLLRRLGCNVVVEPNIGHIQGKDTSPDFLATNDSTGYSFYVEATVQTDGRAQQYDEFEREIKATLDQLRCPDFIVCIDQFRITSKQWTPSTKRLARYVEKRLLELRAEPSARAFGPLTFQGHGWRLTFHFESRSEQELWVKPTRSLKETGSTRAVYDTENIRKAIKDKASHYGYLNHPFIIAINVREHLVTPETVFEALYGSVKHVFNVVPHEGRVIGDLEFSHFQPKYNGAFRARGRQHTRVSAVWVASSLFGPSAIGSADMYQFENHFAEDRFQPNFPCLPSCL